MTIILTKPVRVGGVELAAATTQTFAADVEADLVSRASAAYTINPTIGQGGVPVMADINNLTGGISLQAGEAAYKVPQTSYKNIIAHRGGGMLVAPDNSMSGYKYAIANNLMHIEQDVYLLADGSLGCMHDSTIDRTTTGTGSVSALTGAQFKALEIDPPTFLGGIWQSESPPLFDEVLREIGNKGAVLWPEAKNTGAAAAIVSALLRHNVSKDKAVLQSGILDDLSYAVQAGYGAAFGINPATADFPALAAVGVTHVWHYVWTAPQAQAALANGIKPVAYTIDRRSDYALLKSMGIDLIFSDDPVWVAEATTPMKKDMYISQMWHPGMSSNAERGAFFPPASFGWGNTAGGYYGCLQGWACPIKGSDSASSFVIDFDLQIDQISSADRHADIFICANSDSKMSDDPSDAVSGYHLLVRATGTLQIYKRPAGSLPTKIAEITGTALTLGQVYSVKITVTPTTVSFSIPSLSRVVSISDADFRGGYFHFGRAGAAVKYKNVVIS